MTETKSVKASSIRRALTTLKKASMLIETKCIYDNFESKDVVFIDVTYRIPVELTQKKKHIRQSQTKKTKK